VRELTKKERRRGRKVDEGIEREEWKELFMRLLGGVGNKVVMGTEERNEERSERGREKEERENNNYADNVGDHATAKLSDTAAGRIKVIGRFGFDAIDNPRSARYSTSVPHHGTARTRSVRVISALP